MKVNTNIAIYSTSACLLIFVIPATTSVFLPTSVLLHASDLSYPECCQSTCCDECDPDLPDIDTPFFGTGHQIPDTIIAEDGTVYDSTSYIGRKFVGIFNGTDHEETLAFIFASEFSDDLVVEVAVHPLACGEDAQEAEILASTYSEVLGRVPKIFRNNITNFHLRPGGYDDFQCSPMSEGGTVNLCKGVAEELLSSGNCEEVFMHEGTHINLGFIQETPEWRCAQNKDQMFISSYARDNWDNEDVPESVVPWYAVTYRADRVGSETVDIIQEAIPNRLQYFDSHLHI